MKAKFVNEKFSEDSDPIRDMGIGMKPDKDLEDVFYRLKKQHPRSSHTQRFIDNVISLLRDPELVMPRSKFKVAIGEQWGLNFVDELIKYKKLHSFKDGNKIMLTSPLSTLANESKIKEFNDTILDKIRGRGGGNMHGVQFKYDKKLMELTLFIEETIITWVHYEKGHGQKIYREEQDKQIAQVREKLEDSYFVKNATEIFKEFFGTFKIKTNEIYDRYSITSAKPGWGQSPQGHKGFDYTFQVIISPA